MASNNSKDRYGGAEREREREKAGKTAALVSREMQEAAGENKHAIVTDNHNNRTLHSGALNDFQYVRRRIASREKRPRYDAQWKIKCGKVLEVNT